MSEMKCPFCGDAMVTTKDQIVVCENPDCATMFNEWDYPKACAAMELAKAESWEEETDDVRAYLDDTLEDCDAWDEIVNTNISAERAVFDARDRVIEVFK